MSQKIFVHKVACRAWAEGQKRKILTQYVFNLKVCLYLIESAIFPKLPGSGFVVDCHFK